MDIETLDRACGKCVESLRARIEWLDGAGPSIAAARLWRDSKTGERLLGDSDVVGIAPRSGRLGIAAPEAERIERIEREASKRGYRVIRQEDGCSLEIETPQSMRVAAKERAVAMKEPALTRLRLCARAHLKMLGADTKKTDPGKRLIVRDRLKFWESQAVALVDSCVGVEKKKSAGRKA